MLSHTYARADVPEIDRLSRLTRLLALHLNSISRFHGLYADESCLRCDIRHRPDFIVNEEYTNRCPAGQRTNGYVPLWCPGKAEQVPSTEERDGQSDQTKANALNLPKSDWGDIAGDASSLVCRLKQLGSE